MLWGGRCIGTAIQDPAPVLAATAVFALGLFFILGVASWMFPLLSRFEKDGGFQFPAERAEKADVGPRFIPPYAVDSGVIQRGESQKVPAHYRRVAEETGCHFLDANAIGAEFNQIDFMQ